MHRVFQTILDPVAKNHMWKGVLYSNTHIFQMCSLQFYILIGFDVYLLLLQSCSGTTTPYFIT